MCRLLYYNFKQSIIGLALETYCFVQAWPDAGSQKPLLIFHIFAYFFVNLKSQMNWLIFIISLYSWICPSLVLMMRLNILPPESVFSFSVCPSLLHLPPSCVCAPDSNDGPIHVCGCVPSVWAFVCRICRGWRADNELSTYSAAKHPRQCFYEV